MKTELQLLRLASIIDSPVSANVNADGYTSPVGTTYTAPIGDMETGSDETAALEAGMLRNESYEDIGQQPTKTKPLAMPPIEQDDKERDADTETKVKTEQSITDRLKANPILTVAIITAVALLCYYTYKRKK